MVQVVFPPRSFMKQAYPRMSRFPLICFAYIARIFRVAWKFNWENFIMAYRTGKAARRADTMRD